MVLYRPSRRYVGFDILVRTEVAEKVLGYLREYQFSCWGLENELSDSGKILWIPREGGRLSAYDPYTILPRTEGGWGYNGLILPSYQEGEYTVFTIRIPRVRNREQSRYYPFAVSGNLFAMINYGLYRLETDTTVPQLFAFDLLNSLKPYFNIYLEVSAEAVSLLDGVAKSNGNPLYYGEVWGRATDQMIRVAKRLGWSAAYGPMKGRWVEVRDGGWFFLEHPGSCTFNPVDFDEVDPSEGYLMTSNNIDNPEQQLIVLAGLVSIWEKLHDASVNEV